MTIRPATPDDVPRVLPMVAAICAMHEAIDPVRYAMLPEVVEQYGAWLPARALDRQSVFLVGEEHGPSPRIVAFLVATVEPNIPIYRAAEFGMIHDVWVEPGHRGRGIARALVTDAIERFREMGVPQVRLETAAANTAARALFASCGFRIGTVDMLMDTGRPGPT